MRRWFPTVALVLTAAAPVRAEWADRTIDARIEGRYASNVNQASARVDEEHDIWFQPSVRFAQAYQAAERTRLIGAARLGGEIYGRFDGLNAFLTDGRIAVSHKMGVGDVPWVQVFGAGGRRSVEVSQRTGPWFDLGLSAGQRFTPRWNARFTYRYGQQYGANGPPVLPGLADDVFDQRHHTVSIDARYAVTPGLLARVGFHYRYGDFESNAREDREGPLQQADVEAVALDQVFGGWVYRVRGNAYSPMVGLNYGFDRQWSVDLAYRFQYASGGGLQYRNHAVNVAVLFRY